MLALLGAILGAIIGWWRAGKRGGNTADKLQYAAVHGIILLLVGYFLALFLVRYGVV